MLKNKINIKLINICLFVLTCLLIYKSGTIWINLINLLSRIFMPFILSFFFAYALNPLVKIFQKKFPKGLSIMLVILIIIMIITFTILILTPTIIKQINNLFKEIIIFINHIQSKYNIEIKEIQKPLINALNNILISMSTNITNFALNIFNIIANYFSFIVVFISSSIYFLIDMNKISENIRKICKNERIYSLLKNIDHELKNYFKSFSKIMFITFFEYSISFFIIGHPDFLLLGILASLASIIPCFGGIIVNILSAITAFVIGTKLFIRTLILFCFLSLIDGYIINPIVYGKSNRLPAILTIFATFAGGILFKFLGIIIALPLTIILLTIYRFFKSEICGKIKDEMRNRYDTKTKRNI